MWVLTNFGAFMPSLHKTEVDADGAPMIQVRCRRAVDLNKLRKRYMGKELGPNIRNAGTDYQYRALCTQQAWADAMYYISLDIDYTSFKATAEDAKLHNLYMRIWSVILGAFPEGSPYGSRLRGGRAPHGATRPAGQPADRTNWWDDAAGSIPMNSHGNRWQSPLPWETPTGKPKKGC